MKRHTLDETIGGMDISGMRRSRSIDVSIEHRSEIVEYAAKPDQPWVTGILPIARGPVQLVVDMPARSLRMLVVALVPSVYIFCIIAIELSLLKLVPLPGPPIPVDPVLVAAAVGVIAFLGAALRFGVGAHREVLEIDSRFVSVRRTRESVVTLSRGCCVDVTVAEAPRTGLPGFFDRHLHEVPWIVLGNGTQAFMSTGSGISRTSAVRIVEAIRAFMAEYPPDPDFDGPDGVVRLHYPMKAGSAVRPTSAST